MSANAGGLIVCLVGFPGVGKLTIAKILSRMIGAKIVDNHWINDPILGLIADDGSKSAPAAIWPQVAKVREAVLDTISTLAPAGASFIFTYAGADEDLQRVSGIPKRCRAARCAIRRRPPLVRRGRIISPHSECGASRTKTCRSRRRYRQRAELHSLKPACAKYTYSRHDQSLTRGRRHSDTRPHQCWPIRLIRH